METPTQGFVPDEEEDINRLVFKFIIIGALEVVVDSNLLGSVSVGKSSLLLQVQAPTIALTVSSLSNVSTRILK